MRDVQRRICTSYIYDLTAVPYNEDGRVALGLFCSAKLPDVGTVRPGSLRFVN
jgi:hypothetical protein